MTAPHIAHALTLIAGLGIVALGMSGCRTEHSAPPDPVSTASLPISRAPSLPQEPPTEVVPVPVPGDVPAFYLRGERGTTARMVFLHGRCAHAQGYVQAFQFAAAKRGAVVAPQGDIVCGGAFRRWTSNAELQNRRIEAAFRAAGDHSELRDLLVIGYSQGEVLAERLVELYPERYARAVLIGAPSVPSVERLRSLRGAVMVSGEYDAKNLMKEGARRLQSAGVPSTYLEMPRAKHAQMTDGERVMEDAFSWLEANERRSP